MYLTRGGGGDDSVVKVIWLSSCEQRGAVGPLDWQQLPWLPGYGGVLPAVLTGQALQLQHTFSLYLVQRLA